MVARGGAGCEGSDSVAPLCGGRLDSVSFLGGVRVTLDSVSSAPPTRVGAIGSGFLSL